VSSERHILAGKREGDKVDPASDVKSVKHGVHLLSHVGERTSSVGVVISFFLVSRSNLDYTIHTARCKGSTWSGVVSNTVDCLFIVALLLLVCNPHLDVDIPVALADCARWRAESELISKAIPACVDVCDGLSGYTLLRLESSTLVLLPDNAWAIVRGWQESVGVFVPVQRAHVGVMLCEDFKKSPIVAVKVVISSEDEDVFSLGTDSNLWAISVVSEAMNTGVDTVLFRLGLWWHICFNL